MHVRIPFTYRAGVERLNGASNEATYKGEALVEVREATSASAPVALRYEHEGSMVEMLWFDDKLYGALSHVDHTGRKAPLTATHLADSQSPTNPLRQWNPGHISQRLEDDTNIQRVNYTTEQHDRNRLEASAAKLLLVGARLWAVAREPILVVEMHRQVGDQPKPRGVVVTSELDSACHVSHVFRMDEGHLLSFCPLVDQTGCLIDPPFVDVTIPQCLRTRASEENLIAAAATLCGEMNKFLEGATIPYFVGYANLRDAVKDSTESLKLGGEPDVRPLAKATKEALVAKRAHVESVLLSPGAGVTAAEKNARSAIWRWNASLQARTEEATPGMSI